MTKAREDTLTIPEPVVPGFVADWYEYNQDHLQEAILSALNGYQIELLANRTFDALISTNSGTIRFNEPIHWYIHEEPDALTVLVLMQFGYRVQRRADLEKH